MAVCATRPAQSERRAAPHPARTPPPAAAWHGALADNPHGGRKEVRNNPSTTQSTEILAGDRYFSTHEVGGILGVTASSVVKWANEGRLKAFSTPGGHRRISSADLIRFAQSHGMPLPKALGQSAARVPPGRELRLKLRRERSREIIRRLQTWSVQVRALPESALGKAIAYMGGIWKGLTRFLDDPRIPLDDNTTERALRGVVIGRKNHYGSRSRRGTEVAALFYSLLESAKLACVEPRQYLRQAAVAAIRGLPIPLPHELPVQK